MAPSEQTHKKLIESLPTITGKAVGDWLIAVNEGPSLLRSEERVAWLRAEHELPYAHASAIVHEDNLRRAARIMQ